MQFGLQNLLQNVFGTSSSGQGNNLSALMQKFAPQFGQGQQPSQQPVQMPMGGSGNPNFFSMMAPPQGATFDVTAAQGTKPKNYTPVGVSMSNIPGPSMLGAAGVQAPMGAFQVTNATGTKPKNYTPVSVAMMAPSPVGAANMQQVLQMMGGAAPTPFAPYGQGQ